MLTTILTTTGITAFTVIVTIMIYEYFSEDKPMYIKEEEPTVKENPYIKCQECSCILDKRTASKVVSNFCGTSYYCPTHEKPYNKEYYSSMYPTRYFLDESIEVTKEGKPIKK